MHIEEGAPAPYSAAWSPWIAYYGEGHPLKPGTRVRVRLRAMDWSLFAFGYDEFFHTRRAEGWNWEWDRRIVSSQIVSFSFHIEDELNG